VSDAAGNIAMPITYPEPMFYNDGLDETFIEKNRNRLDARELNALR
jgi:hypothetical protein